VTAIVQYDRMRLSRKRMALTTLLLLSVTVYSCHAWLGFDWPGFSKTSPSRFKFEGWISLESLGLKDGMVAAVGDVDGDQILDLFVLSADQSSVSLWLWNKGLPHRLPSQCINVACSLVHLQTSQQ
jgi:hypothetical protein